MLELFEGYVDVLLSDATRATAHACARITFSIVGVRLRVGTLLVNVYACVMTRAARNATQESRAPSVRFLVRMLREPVALSRTDINLESENRSYVTCRLRVLYGQRRI